jgi:hypothetical protein
MVKQCRELYSMVEDLLLVAVSYHAAMPGSESMPVCMTVTIATVIIIYELTSNKLKACYMF